MRWNGLTKASGVVDAIDDNEYSGSLIILLQEAYNFVLRNSKKAWMKENDKRVELPDYPERAVMEGIVNALIHRSYTELGSEVHIDMFDDRLEIYSPGGMVGGISIEDVDILNVPSKRRNPILADIFGRLKYMERRGSGFKKIINAYETQQNYRESLKPIFNSFNNDFILTLFNLNYSANVPQDVPQDVLQDDLDIKILDLIKNNNKISTQEIGRVLGVSDKTIKRHIKNIDNLKYIGSGYSGHWEIID